MTCPINRERMLEKVLDMIQSADDATLEECYWFLAMELGN